LDERVVASPTGDGWTGELRKADGSTLPFTLAPSLTGTAAGLFDAAIPEGKVGVVVVQAKGTDAPVLFGGIRAATGKFEQVLPVREVSLSAQGLEVRVANIARTFFVQRTQP
jgi:hypothetical protein